MRIRHIAQTVVTLTSILISLPAKGALQPILTKDRVELLFESRLDPAGNTCEREIDCFVAYKGTATTPPCQVPKVAKATVDQDQFTLHLQLSGEISLSQQCAPKEGSPPETIEYNLRDFEIVLRRVQLRGAEKPGFFRVALAPSVQSDPESRKGIIYQALQRVTRIPEASAITVEAEDADGNEFKTKVKSAAAAERTLPPEGSETLRLELNPPLPRGKTWTVSVTGVETYGGKGITGTGDVEIDSFPKGREDATIYIRGEKIYNQLGDDQGSVDFKLEQNFAQARRGREWWYLLSATVGSESLGLSQTGTASLGKRWWLGIDDNLATPPIWAVSLAPTFRTDKDFHNRDAGLDLILEGEPPAWYRTIEAKRIQFPKQKAFYGWWLKPRFAIEAGEHLASSSDQVEGETFSRALAGFNLLLERAEIFTDFDTLSLTLDAAGRYLAEDEVTIDEENVLTIEDGYKPYLRAELAYGFGPVALSIVHENGKLPPAFKTARATTVGVTFKF